MSKDSLVLDKLTFESAVDGTRVTMEFYPGSDISDFMQEVKKLALAIGYAPASVDAGFLGVAEEIEVANFNRQDDPGGDDPVDFNEVEE